MKTKLQYQGKVADTSYIAQELSKILQGGEVVALSGPLGAGKTTLVKHLAKNLGFKGLVSSPTFSIMQVYEPTKLSSGKVASLHHYDWYRLENEQELTALELEEYLGSPDTVSIIEWADKFPGALKKYNPINITLFL